MRFLAVVLTEHVAGFAVGSYGHVVVGAISRRYERSHQVPATQVLLESLGLYAPQRICLPVERSRKQALDVNLQYLACWATAQQAVIVRYPRGDYCESFSAHRRQNRKHLLHEARRRGIRIDSPVAAEAVAIMDLALQRHFLPTLEGRRWLAV